MKYDILEPHGTHRRESSTIMMFRCELLRVDKVTLIRIEES